MPKSKQLTSAESMDTATPSSTSLGQDMYDRIRADLMAIRIEPGERLTVDALARDYLVSQTPIREALSRLESDGLVVKTHLRGFRATPMLTHGELAAVYEIRLLLEPFAARRAAELRTDNELAVLKSVQHDLEGCLDAPARSARHSRFAELDARLHDQIAAAGKNELVRESLGRLHSHLHIFRLRRDRVVAEAAVSEHAVILDAIVRTDPNVAEAAMRTHIERSWARIPTDPTAGISEPPV